MKIERLIIEVDLQTDVLDDETFVDTLRDTSGIIGVNVKSTKQLYPPVENTQFVYKGHDADGNSIIEALKRSVTPPLIPDPSKTATINWVHPKDFE